MIDFFFNTVRFYTSGIEPFFTAHRRTDGYEFFLNYIQDKIHGLFIHCIVIPVTVGMIMIHENGQFVVFGREYEIFETFR